jgi:histidinol-phosphate aminotransferase
MKIRQSIKELKAYDPQITPVDIMLHANETQNYLFSDSLIFSQNTSKYPDATGTSLRTELAKKYEVTKDNVLIGNGSTELLELSVKAFTEPNDVILSFDPSFAMYEIYGTMHQTRFVKVPVNEDMTMDLNTMKAYDEKYNPSLIFLCIPNNPTGQVLEKSDVIDFVKSTKSLVIIDEAYMEFFDESQSMIDQINTFENIIVARTFSKAYGLANARLGFVLANNNIIQILLKVKLPYSVNGFSIDLGLRALQKSSKVDSFIQNTIIERQRLFEELSKLPLKVYTSNANFLFLKSYTNLQEKLLEYGILIRSFNNGFYRITVGTKKENKKVIQALKEVLL